MQKAFGVERLSCLTLLFNIVWESGTAANRGGGSPVKKGGLECANYRGITLVSLPGKVYSMVLERSVWPIVQTQIEEEQCGLTLISGPALHIHKDPGGGLGVCPSSLHGFCESGEGV